MEVSSKPARSDRFGYATTQVGSDGNVFTDIKDQVDATRRNSIPRLALAKRHRLHPYTHRGDVDQATNGNIGGTTVHGHIPTARSSCTFGKDDQVVAGPNRRNAVVNHVGA